MLRMYLRPTLPRKGWRYAGILDQTTPLVDHWESTLRSDSSQWKLVRYKMSALMSSVTAPAPIVRRMISAYCIIIIFCFMTHSLPSAFFLFIPYSATAFSSQEIRYRWCENPTSTLFNNHMGGRKRFYQLGGFILGTTGKGGKANVRSTLWKYNVPVRETLTFLEAVGGKHKANLKTWGFSTRRGQIIGAAKKRQVLVDIGRVISLIFAPSPLYFALSFWHLCLRLDSQPPNFLSLTEMFSD